MAHFIIAAGGTGMRLLEAFVHQCAAGIYAGEEFNIFSIDTDSENHNRTDVIALLDWYQQIREPEPAGKEGLFSARLNTFHYVTKMPQSYNNNLMNILSNEANSEVNETLSKLLFSEKVRQFNLDHGYRAQTQLGSLHMYSTIRNSSLRISQNRQVDDNDRVLQSFIQTLNNADDNSRVMILGSLFGGTGASSVPILPRALEDALHELSGENATLKGKRFGCAVMTDYFTFQPPQGEQRQDVIAKSERFRENSLLALDYYNGNMAEYYKNIYVVGNNAIGGLDYTLGKGAEVVTGGANQDNPAHYLELVTAGSIYHFITAENEQTEYFYKTLNSGNEIEQLDFETFIHQGDQNQLEKGFAALTALAIIKQAFNANSIAQFVKENNYLQIKGENLNTNSLDNFVDRFSKFYNDVVNSGSGIERTSLLNQRAVEDRNIGSIYINSDKHFKLPPLSFKKAQKSMALMIEGEWDVDRVLNEPNQQKVANVIYNKFNELTNS